MVRIEAEQHDAQKIGAAAFVQALMSHFIKRKIARAFHVWKEFNGVAIVSAHAGGAMLRTIALRLATRLRAKAWNKWRHVIHVGVRTEQAARYSALMSSQWRVSKLRSVFATLRENSVKRKLGRYRFKAATQRIKVIWGGHSALAKARAFRKLQTSPVSTKAKYVQALKLIAARVDGTHKQLLAKGFRSWVEFSSLVFTQSEIGKRETRMTALSGEIESLEVKNMRMNMRAAAQKVLYMLTLWANRRLNRGWRTLKRNTDRKKELMRRRMKKLKGTKKAAWQIYRCVFMHMIRFRRYH